MAQFYPPPHGGAGAPPAPAADRLTNRLSAVMRERPSRRKAGLWVHKFRRLRLPAPPVPPPAYIRIGLRVAHYYPAPNDGRGTRIVVPPAAAIPVPMIMYDDVIFH